VYSSFKKKRNIKNMCIGNWDTKIENGVTFRMRKFSNSVELGMLFAMKQCQNVFVEVSF